jgi:mRNA-degrading endonuclease RelE of RelBE toxin-antitoxin system
MVRIVLTESRPCLSVCFDRPRYALYSARCFLDKLDEIVDAPWRDLPDYGEPLQNSPRKKVRVGEFRLAVTFRQSERRIVVARIKHRGGAYTADDD